MRRSMRGATALSLAGFFALAGCGGSTPIAVPSGGNGGLAEVPRDQDETGSAASAKPATTHPPVLVSDPSPSETSSSAALAASTAKPVETTAATPPPRGKSKGGPKLSTKECSEMIDRYLDLTIAGPGGPLAEMSGKELEQGKAQLKALAASDKSFADLQSTCEKSSTRGQYDCAMNAGSSKEWQNCVR